MEVTWNALVVIVVLFVSRRIGVRDYGVFDTDDGIEQRATTSDLVDAVLFCNLEIGGVSHTEFPIRPYQPIETKTQLQLKTKLLSFVDITTWDGMLTNITWDSHKIRRPVSIRVSDFGTQIAEFVFSGNDVSGTHKLTLIFDDKIKPVEPFSLQPLVCPASIKGRDMLGLVFDFREVTDDKLACSLYNSILASVENQRRFSFPEVFCAILDDKSRKYRLLRMSYPI